MENQTVGRIDESGWTAGALLRHSARRLIAAGIATGARDAEVLLGHALGVSRERLVARAHEAVDDRQGAVYERLLLRRLEHEPVAYITGAREFWSLEFRVTRDVLIPRPETELLVETALEWARRRAADAAPLRIADIGTGSGAIAVALAAEVTTARLVATDISPRVLALARTNALQHHVGDRIQFIGSDLFAALPAGPSFDLIVSNPPYIPGDDVAALEPDVSRWEPRAALDGGADGLDFYRRFAAQAGRHLAVGGALLLEIGAGMGGGVAQIFEEAGDWGGVFIRNDYAGRERAVIVRSIARVE